MISIVQNFICTKKDRLNLLQEIIPKLSNIFKEYPFYVNYNTKINFELVYSLYKTHIKKLNFFNTLNKDWAQVTLQLVNKIKTPYVLYVCEDHYPHMNNLDFNNIIDECFNKNSVEYLLLTRIGKYNQQEYIDGKNNINNNNVKPYIEGKFGYFYKAKNAPHKRLSINAIYKTSFFKDRLLEFITTPNKYIHDIPVSKLNLPNFYEGFYDFNNGMVRFGDMQCYIPKKTIFVEYDKKER